MRKLASVQKILNLEPIENADAIERAKVLGWGVVVKKGEFKVEDLAVYFEIDSLLPNIECFSFLDKNKTGGKTRLRTVKLRGCLSQGLLMPLSIIFQINPNIQVKFIEDMDLTEILGIEKYEPSIPANLQGVVRSTFPSIWHKTDEERIQGNPKYLELAKDKPYYITAKLDGTSGSFGLIYNNENKAEFTVCSRNMSLEDNGNTYWTMAKKYDLETKITKYYENNGIMLYLQGEIVGPSIQGNKLGLTENDLYVFNITEVETSRKFNLSEMIYLCKIFGLKMVPIIEKGLHFNYSQKELLALAEFKYHSYFPTAKSEQEGEGIVIRTEDQEVSFKAISNKFLLGKGNDE